MEVKPLAVIFDEDDWQALLDSEDITQDEYDAWSDATEDYQFDQRWEAEVRKRASAMAADANDSLQTAKDLRKLIINHGGISSSDYEDMPAKYIRKSGFALDAIATEIGFADDTEAYEAIQQAERILRDRPIVSGRPVNFRVKDCLAAASAQLCEEKGRKWDPGFEEEVPF